MHRRFRAPFFLAVLLGFCVVGAAAARADTTVSFYSHGWGVRGDLFIYFPHAFVVIRRDGQAGAADSTRSYGYTAVSQGPDALTGPTPGEVIPADPAYVGRSVLRLTVEATDSEYRALIARVAAWSGPRAPPYDLRHHNCVGFVADLAAALDLTTPKSIGADPARYLDALARLNPGREVEAAGKQAR